MKRLIGFILALAIMLTLPVSPAKAENDDNGRSGRFVPGHIVSRRDYGYPTLEQESAFLQEALRLLDDVLGPSAPFSALFPCFRWASSPIGRGW